MTTTTRILAFAGSLRRDSFNKRLVKLAGEAARDAGADVTYLDLREVPMPLYDGDLEEAEGLPANAKRLKQLMKEHQGFLISSPEYNSSFSAALKNAIDWASRAEPNEPPLACFKGKTAALMAASPGQLGGMRGLVGVRWILGNLSVLVIPEQVTISKAHEAFLPDGKLADPKSAASVDALAARLVHVTRSLAAPR